MHFQSVSSNRGLHLPPQVRFIEVDDAEVHQAQKDVEKPMKTMGFRLENDSVIQDDPLSMLGKLQIHMLTDVDRRLANKNPVNMLQTFALA